MTTITHQEPSPNFTANALEAIRNNKGLQLLAVLLLVQLLIAIVLGVLNNRSGEFASGDPVFEFVSDNINQLEITDNDNTVNLTRSEDQWQIAGEPPLPVDQSRIDSLLLSLTQLKTGLPVASTRNSRAQLQVGDDNYQRKLTVTQGDSESATLLLGTSPGLRKAHLRQQDSDNIYSATLPVSDVPASVDYWLKKTLVAFDQITGISSDEITFTQNGEGDSATWTANSTDSGTGESPAELDTAKLSAAVSALQSLQVIGIAQPPTTATDSDSDGESKAQADPAAFTVNDGNSEIQVSLSQQDNTYQISRSDVAGKYEISSAIYNQLIQLAQRASWFPQEDSDTATDTD